MLSNYYSIVYLLKNSLKETLANKSKFKYLDTGNIDLEYERLSERSLVRLSARSL